MKDYQARAAVLKAIAHPMRLQIVDILRGASECVCHLSAALDKPQPYISQQLAILRNGGVIVDEREGTNIFYRLTDAHVARIVEAACGSAPATERDATGKQRRVIHGCHCPKCAGDTPNRG